MGTSIWEAQGFKVAQVSIQLVSPASGDVALVPNLFITIFNVSIQLVSPASGDTTIW